MWHRGRYTRCVCCLISSGTKTDFRRFSQLDLDIFAPPPNSPSFCWNVVPFSHSQYPYSPRTTHPRSLPLRLVVIFRLFLALLDKEERETDDTRFAVLTPALCTVRTETRRPAPSSPVPLTRLPRRPLLNVPLLPRPSPSRPVPLLPPLHQLPILPDLLQHPPHPPVVLPLRRFFPRTLQFVDFLGGGEGGGEDEMADGEAGEEGLVVGCGGEEREGVLRFEIDDLATKTGLDCRG